MIETAIFIVGLIVGGVCVRAYFEHYMTVDREDAAKDRSGKDTEIRALNKKVSELNRSNDALNRSNDKLQAELNELSKGNHVLADKVRALESEKVELTQQLDSEIANYQAMLDQVDEDQTMMEANHKAEIESLQAHIVPPKDYPNDVVDKAAMFDHLHPHFQKMARRKYEAVTDKRKHHAE